MPRQYTPRIQCTCETCGTVFYRPPGEVRKSVPRFCSRACINRTHGATAKGSQHRSEHRIWVLMRQRCNNLTNPAYHHYGGRGITVCPEWDDFAQFFADMGPRPSPIHELERENNDGPYSAANCRWATRTDQMNNVRRNVRLTFEGRTFTAAQWARELGLQVNTIYGRLREGWSVSDALSTPAGGRQRPRDPLTNRFTKR